MGKRKVKSEEAFQAKVLPEAKDVIGIARKMLGGDRLLVSCQDGKERLCRIRGKMKRRMWIRMGDIVLVSPWDFQPDKRVPTKNGVLINPIFLIFQKCLNIQPSHFSEGDKSHELLS